MSVDLFKNDVFAMGLIIVEMVKIHIYINQHLSLINTFIYINIRLHYSRYRDIINIRI